MPWPVEPAGYLSLTLCGLAEMVADSAAFRVACGLDADDDDAQEKLIFGAMGATKRIHLCAFDEVDDDGKPIDFRDDLPKVVISAERATTIVGAGGQSNELVPDSREFRILLVDGYAEGGLEAAYLTHMNLVGQMEKEINAQAGLNDLPAIQRTSLEPVGILASRAERASKNMEYWTTVWAAHVGI